MSLHCQTAGESHGPGLVATVCGLPAGLPVDEAFINAELTRRQGGYGRGGRQHIESDRVEILSGVRRGLAIGSPVTMLIRNRDSRLDDLERTPPVHRPRPGHADLAGSIKYLTNDCRETLERASARETAARVAAGALARCLLREFGITSFGMVRAIGGHATAVDVGESTLAALAIARDASDTYCPDPEATQRQVKAIHDAKLAKDTLGGIVEAHVVGCPPGLGSCMDWRDRLDARLAGAVMGIQAIKGVEIGMGFAAASLPGSQVHDPIEFDAAMRPAHNALGFTRPRNNAGGTEGGMTTGQPVVVRAAMKPIATIGQGLPSVDLRTLTPERSQHERSDICAVAAASVVVENVCCFEIARVLREKFSGDSLKEMRLQHQAFIDAARSL
ncbi:MAG: chorismate synthase [Phycisphaerae bacterium]|jgi:chorismate synthase